MENYFVLGKDKRYDCLFRILENRGNAFRRVPSENETGTVIFPMKIDSTVLAVAENLPFGTRITVGKMNEELKAIAEKRNLECIELLRDERYLISNAVSTSEGALCEIIKNTDECISGQTALVIGYGNCGKKIAERLWLLGAEIYIYSHESSLKRASDDGYNAFDIRSPRLKMFDFIVNTAPGEIFTSEITDNILPTTAVFQVASGDCGDPEDFANRGIKYFPLPSLPAKYSPESDAWAIYRTLCTAKR